MPDKITHKPRLRKTAPTVRQRVEQARIEAEKPKKEKRRRSFLKVLIKPLKKIRIPRNRFTKPIITVFSFIGRILKKLVPRYFINSWYELKQVTWPGRIETWRLTGAVLSFAIVFGVAIAIVDKILSEIFKNFILK